MPNFLSFNDQSAYAAPAAVYNWRVYALALSASMGSAMFGYDSAFIGGSITLDSFKKEFGLDSSKGDALAALKANIVSTFQAGCFFGAILVYYLTERFGRKFPLVGCGVIFDIGVILEMASRGSLGMIYGGRALTGLAVGSSSLMVPQYISECSPPAIRGRLVGLFEVVLQFALVVGFWVNYGVNQNISSTSSAQWQIPFGLQFIFGTLLILLMLFQPESPRWLLSVGREETAISVLTNLRQLPTDDPYILWEIDAIKDQLRREEELGANKTLLKKLVEVFKPDNRTRLFLGMALMMLQNFSGINALNYYSPEIFTSIGFKGNSISLLATGVFGLVKCFATLAFMLWGVDHLGRRKSMLIGSTGAIVAMYYLGAFSKLSGSFEHTAKKDAGAYVAILMVYVYAVFYAISWNGIPWIFCAEVFPTAIRAVCLVFTTCTQWVGQFIIVYSTPYMMTNITYGTFLLFGTSVVIGIVVVFLFMPETKNLSLEEMDILFNISGMGYQQRSKADHIIAEMRAAENVAGAEKDAVSTHSEVV